MKYNITLGDWSGDGHEKTETFIVKIPKKFSSSDLSSSYEKSVAEFGFKLSDIAKNYDDNEVPAKIAEKLISAGFNADLFDTLDEGDYKGRYFIISDEFVDLIMFMVGRHLDDFSWKLIEDSRPSLVGGYDAIIENRSSVGYGLFDNY